MTSTLTTSVKMFKPHKIKKCLNEINRNHH